MVGEAVQVRAWGRWMQFFFFNLKSLFWEISALLWSWNIQNIFELSFYLILHKQTTSWYPDFQIFYGEILNFCLFSRKIAIFRFHDALWRHNYKMTRPILFILVCIDRGDQHLSIDTRSKKNLLRGLQQPHVLQNSLVRRGLTLSWKVVYLITKMCIRIQIYANLKRF